MSIAFVHLSDIHFGQEKGGQVVINDDVKERLLEDVAEVVRSRPGGRAAGVIVSGDIAYSGKAREYKMAGQWLDRLAGAVGCSPTDIQVVPGNHDIDRDEITVATRMMLDQVTKEGESRLDEFLAGQRDRELLYARFSAYRPFAEGYNCSLDDEGGNAGDRTLELAPGRTLRFVGLNTALICSSEDEMGKLLLGARQRVLPRTIGEELVAVAHHPLHWLQDSDDARRFIRNRARVLISGHEHKPDVKLDKIADGQDLLMLSAGATIPPRVTDKFNYTYNVIEFMWDEVNDGLKVVVHPRAWSDDKKEFVLDSDRLPGQQSIFELGCPNFRACRPTNKVKTDETAGNEGDQGLISPQAIKTGGDASSPSAFVTRGEVVLDAYPPLLLRFFRDLTSGQRLAVLVNMGALPSDWPEQLTHTAERRILDSLRRTGRLEELDIMIDKVQANNK